MLNCGPRSLSLQLSVCYVCVCLSLTSYITLFCYSNTDSKITNPLDVTTPSLQLAERSYSEPWEKSGTGGFPRVSRERVSSGGEFLSDF